MSGNLDQFLMSLKRFNGAGVINTLGGDCYVCGGLRCACTVNLEMGKAAKAPAATQVAVT